MATTMSIVEEHLIKLCIDTECFYEQPNASDIRMIKDRIVTNRREVTIKELSQEISDGKSFTSSLFIGVARKNKDFESSSLIVLDFNNDTQLSDIIDKCRECDLVPNIIYEPFLDNTSSGSRLRVIFVFDCVITDSKVYTTLFKRLRGVFPECNDMTEGAYSLWLGGKEILYLDVRPNKYSYLVLLVNAFEVALRAYDHKSRTVQTSVLLNDAKVDSMTKTSNIVEHTGIDTLCNKVKLMNSLANNRGCFDRDIETSSGLSYKEGEKLHYMQILGLASNLKYIKGGLKWLSIKMEDAECFDEYHFSALYQVRNRNYQPMDMRDFNPYHEDCEYTNILHATGRKGYTITPVLEVDNNNASSNDHQVDKLPEIISSSDIKIHVIKTPLELVEPSYLLDLLKNDTVCMGFQTNRSISEFVTRCKIDEYNRYVENDKQILYTLPLPDAIDSNDKLLIEYYYNVGCYSKARSIVLELIDDYKKQSNDKHTILQNYLDNNDRVYRSTTNSIITTAYNMNMTRRHSFKHCKRQVFVGCPISSMFRIHKISRADIYTLQDMIDNDKIKEYLTYLNDSIEMSKSECIGMSKSECEPRKFNLSEEELRLISRKIGWLKMKNISIDSNLFDFLNCRYFRVDDKLMMHYIVFNDIDDDKETIVYTQTYNKFIYDKIFDANVTKVYSYDPKPIGTLIQDHEYSFSRQSLSITGGAIKHARNNIGDNTKVITFRKKTRHFKNSVKDIYFGNYCYGCTRLVGQDIAVVGTPHCTREAYELFALMLGISCGGNRVLKDRIVKKNGYRFRLKTYESEDMQHIQCFFIEKELINTISLNHHISQPCTTYLFSNYPIRV